MEPRPYSDLTHPETDYKLDSFSILVLVPQYKE
jgi:hypothetical protein